MKYEKGGADGERQDHASGDLVERSVDVFERVVAETGGKGEQAQAHIWG